MLVVAYGAKDRPQLERHGRPPIDLVRKHRFAAIIGASRVGKTRTIEALNFLYPGRFELLEKTCSREFRDGEDRDNIRRLDFRDFFKLLAENEDQLLTSIVDFQIPQETKLYLKKKYKYTPPKQEALVMCLHQFLAAFPTDYTEKRVIAAEKRGITMVVELAPWDAMKWKEDFPNTELFWLWAPPKMVAARHKEHGNIRTTNGRARLTEALLSIYRPPEELYSRNPHFLISRKEEDWYLNACYIYKTLFPSV